ncbi:hypothetical protein B0H11DRAFT_1800191 [Mycena galericulata]|nr:hypothetical protein B0H11DRAFT_1800191 [Mycena galericulata]
MEFSPITSYPLAFKQPPSDGYFLPEILTSHAQINPAYPLFRYLGVDGTVKTIPWLDAVRAFHTVAQLVREEVAVADSTSRPVVAILASTDQITYFALIAGVLIAGFQVFPISPRNSEAAVSHLLASADCSHVFVSTEDSTRTLVEAAVRGLEAKGGHLKPIPAPSFDDLFHSSITVDFLSKLDLRPDLQSIAVIMHSSGSVAFPKVIKITYHSLMQFALTPFHGEIDFCGEVWAAHAIPTFHLVGVMQLFWATISGMIISVLPPMSPPVLPTPAKVFDEAIATASTLLFCVPSFLEGWARDSTRRPLLKSFRSVIFAGGPLQPAVGDKLSDEGVNIAHVYGMTEAGGLNLFLPREAPKLGWNYFYLSPHIDPVFLPLADLPGVYKLVVKTSKTHTPAILDTIVDGVEAFNTNDLLVQHPKDANLWKIYGRYDDQIMHSTGEKTNPGPLEAIILEDSRIKHAVMFGRSQFHAGVLIFPAQPLNLVDSEAEVEFRRQIWPAVQKANIHAPSHSRIFKEMILVAKPSKQIELTAKGTPRRAQVLHTYQDEIREIYAVSEQSAQTHLAAPDNFDFLSSLDFVKRVVEEVMHELPADDDDLFQHGCDSLQATWIRNSILYALRASKRVDVGAIADDFVYSYPTLKRLGDYVASVASGSPLVSLDSSLLASEMEKMVLKYTQDFPEHRATVETPIGEAVLLTGTTGALGCHILARLLDLPEVSMVYALNRSGKNIQERQRSSFVNNGVDVERLNSLKLKLLTGNLIAPDLGLSAEDYGEIKERVTCVIHNAWQVDFKMSLTSLEPCIAATRNLIDFSLSSPHNSAPKMIFLSSVGVFKTSEPIAYERSLLDPKTVAGSGYAESKWVAEKTIEQAATQRSAFKPIIVRVGQLSGGIDGIWKTSEWFPTLLRLSQRLGHLPEISGHISWVPIQDAGSIVVEMRKSRKRYLHLTHPHPITLEDIIRPVQEILALPAVGYSQWLESLEKLASKESSDPDLGLLRFFRENHDTELDQEAFLGARLSNDNALEASSCLASLRSLDSRDVAQWVGYLRRAGNISGKPGGT